MVAAMAAVAACWGSMLALRFKSQSAAPLMQAGMMALILTTTAYAPLALLQGWLQDIARVNPVTQVRRSGAAGLRRRRHLGRNLAGTAGAGRDAGGAGRPRPARDAPHGAVMRDAPMRARADSAHRRVELAERVLRQNWLRGRARRASRYAYTEPSPGRYPWQWYWDSCFAAIVWRRFDPARARAELESLLAAQRPDGFIGHTIFWDRPVSLTRLAFYNVASRSAFQTETIQPPLLAWAWRIAVGDPAEEPRIAAQLDWLAANRDLEGDGLLWIVQPDESGLDASPKFDPVWGRRANGRIGFPLLVRRNRRLGFDARRIRERGGPVLCETLVNTMWSLSLQALGRPSATPALVERLWDERRGLFLDEVAAGRRPARRPSPGRRWPRSPCPTCRRQIGRRLVEEHLLNRERVPDPGRAALGRRLGAELRARRRPRPDPPLLARPDLGQLGLDGLAGHAPPRLRGGGAAPRRRPDRARSSAKACASTTTRAPARASAPRTSPGRR